MAERKHFFKGGDGFPVGEWGLIKRDPHPVLRCDEYTLLIEHCVRCGGELTVFAEDYGRNTSVQCKQCGEYLDPSKVGVGEITMRA